MELNWYAAYTKPRWEKKVAEMLCRKNIHNYCPLNKIMKQWHDRKKLVSEPLFTSYVFLHVPEKQLTALKSVDGIINFVHWLKKPAIIKAGEIEAIKIFLNEHENVILEKAVVNINDSVKIIRGPLVSREGNVVDIMNNTVKVHLPSLGHIMIAKVQRTDIQIVINNNFPRLEQITFQ